MIASGVALDGDAALGSTGCTSDELSAATAGELSAFESEGEAFDGDIGELVPMARFESDSNAARSDDVAPRGSSSTLAVSGGAGDAVPGRANGELPAFASPLDGDPLGVWGRSIGELDGTPRWGSSKSIDRDSSACDSADRGRANGETASGSVAVAVVGCGCAACICDGRANGDGSAGGGGAGANGYDDGTGPDFNAAGDGGNAANGFGGVLYGERGSVGGIGFDDGAYGDRGSLGGNGCDDGRGGAYGDRGSLGGNAGPMVVAARTVTALRVTPAVRTVTRTVTRRMVMGSGAMPATAARTVRVSAAHAVRPARVSTPTAAHTAMVARTVIPSRTVASARV